MILFNFPLFQLFISKVDSKLSFPLCMQLLFILKRQSQRQRIIKICRQSARHAARYRMKTKLCLPIWWRKCDNRKCNDEIFLSRKAFLSQPPWEENFFRSPRWEPKMWKFVVKSFCYVNTNTVKKMFIYKTLNFLNTQQNNLWMKIKAHVKRRRCLQFCFPWKLTSPLLLMRSVSVVSLLWVI